MKLKSQNAVRIHVETVLVAKIVCKMVYSALSVIVHQSSLAGFVSKLHVCAAGFTGVDCAEQCTKGTFGQGCAEECHCYGEAACDHVTGECPSGCQEGFKGSACSALSEAASAVETGNDKMDMTAIIGGAVGGVALLALIVGAAVLRKRKKQQADDKLHLADRSRNEVIISNFRFVYFQHVL